LQDVILGEESLLTRQEQCWECSGCGSRNFNTLFTIAK